MVSLNGIPVKDDVQRVSLRPLSFPSLYSVKLWLRAGNAKHVAALTADPFAADRLRLLFFVVVVRNAAFANTAKNAM